MVQGAAEAWIDRLAVTVDGDSWGSGKAPDGKLSKAEARSLATAAVNIPDYSPSASRMARERGAALFRTARVIALGENSHGAAALFRMKFDLVRFLVSERGYKTLALEMPASEADKVNDYVLRRTSDSDAALGSLVYPSWQTEEMWQVVQWLREYDRLADVTVQFRGFDIQQPKLAAAAAKTLIDAAGDPATAATLAALERAMSSGSPGNAAALVQVDTLTRRLAATKPLSAKDARLARYLRILESGLRMDRPDLSGKTRDAYMADEVMAFARRFYLRQWPLLRVWTRSPLPGSERVPRHTRICPVPRQRGRPLSGPCVFADAAPPSSIGRVPIHRIEAAVP